jgi:RNA polymerase sigma-70 factor (ECF subfamily)
VRTALNLRVSWWRRRRREQLWADPPHGVAPEPDEPSDGSLLRAVARLPRRQREVVALRLLLELDTEEAADALGIAAGTVTAHLHRALETLRANPEGVLQR